MPTLNTSRTLPPFLFVKYVFKVTTNQFLKLRQLLPRYSDINWQLHSSPCLPHSWNILETYMLIIVAVLYANYPFFNMNHGPDFSGDNLGELWRHSGSLGGNIYIKNGLKFWTIQKDCNWESVENTVRSTGPSAQRECFTHQSGPGSKCSTRFRIIQRSYHYILAKYLYINVSAFL